MTTGKARFIASLVVVLCATLACAGLTDPDNAEGSNTPVDVEVSFANPSARSVTMEYNGGGRTGSVPLSPGASSAVVFTGVTTFDFNLFVAMTLDGIRRDTSCRLGNTGYQSKKVAVTVGTDEAGAPNLRCVGW